MHRRLNAACEDVIHWHVCSAARVRMCTCTFHCAARRQTCTDLYPTTFTRQCSGPAPASRRPRRTALGTLASPRSLPSTCCSENRTPTHAGTTLAWQRPQPRQCRRDRPTRELKQIIARTNPSTWRGSHHPLRHSLEMVLQITRTACRWPLRARTHPHPNATRGTHTLLPCDMDIVWALPALTVTGHWC